MEELPDVLCINCEDLICISKLSAHSLVCTSPSAQVLQLTSSSLFSQLQFRLIKLKSSLESFFYYRVDPTHKSLKEALESLLKLANEIAQLTTPDIDSIDKLTSISSKIRKITPKLPLSCLVYAERLRALSIEKTYYFIGVIRQQKDKNDISRLLLAKRYGIGNILGNNPFGMGRHMSLECVPEVNSQLDSRTTFKSSIGTPLEDFSSFSVSENPDEITTESHKRFSIDLRYDLKKYFYSRCLIAKLSFSSRHPAQYIQISELYKKTVQNSVEVEKWEEFIKEEFEHPERWVNLNILPR